MSRRLLVPVAGALLLALAAAPRATAEESTSSGPWAGSTLVPDPRPCDGDDVCGRFQREASVLLGTRSISIAFALEVVTTSAGCTPPVAPAPVPSSPSPATFTRPLSFECNGTYRSIATATANLSGGTHTLDRTFAVANPAPDVADTSARAGAARQVAVSWTPLANPPKDIRGYLVLRVAADGAPQPVASLPPTDTTWTDAEVPPEGGSITYVVQTRRAGADPSDAGREVTSAGTASAPIDVAAVPGRRSPSTGPDDTTGGGAGTDPSGVVIAVRGEAGCPRPRSGLRTSTSPHATVPALGAPTVDDGFNERLPYDRRTGAAAVLPDIASGPLAGAPGRGLLIPLATALVLAGWAAHLRILARAAKPTAT